MRANTRPLENRRRRLHFGRNADLLRGRGQVRLVQPEALRGRALRQRRPRRQQVHHQGVVLPGPITKVIQQRRSGKCSVYHADDVGKTFPVRLDGLCKMHVQVTIQIVLLRERRPGGMLLSGKTVLEFMVAGVTVMSSPYGM